MVADFFPSPGLFAAFVAASVVLALTPGPDMALYLSRTFAGGRLHGYAALVGAMSGVIVHTFAAALGLSALIAASARAYDAVKIVGALYLLYLAWGALRHGAALKLEAGGGVAGGLRGAYLTGLLINLTNPKIILFFVTFLPQFIDVGDPDPSRKLFVLGFSFIVIGGLVSAAIIAVAGRFVAAARANPRALRWFDYGFAGLMGAFAARLIFGAAR
jgi:threonine/homoserine/homoserine lactone efflux protein